MRAIDIGAVGEFCAAEYLEEHGYKIKARNFTCREGELDIIADLYGCTVFVEVKTRKNTKFGRPAEFADVRKYKRLQKAALRYTHNPDADMRFDVIEILYEIKYGEFIVKEINHIENAFWDI